MKRNHKQHQTSFGFAGSAESSKRGAAAAPEDSEVIDSESAASPPPLLFRASEDLDEATRRAVERRLGNLIGNPVALTVTDNRHTMISSKRERRMLRVRVHHMFLDANDATVRALARFLTRTDRRAETRLDEFIESNRHKIRRSGRRRAPLRTRGQHHDLGELFDQLNFRFFDGGVCARVTWGRRSPQTRRRRSIRLGTYVAEDQLIRIHPVLDQPWVPRFFVAYVLFHEMLHAVVPAPLRDGRRQFHGPEFRARERAYPDYNRALAWEKANLRRLLAG